jgi:hypothetical protein
MELLHFVLIRIMALGNPVSNSDPDFCLGDWALFFVLNSDPDGGTGNSDIKDKHSWDL